MAPSSPSWVRGFGPPWQAGPGRGKGAAPAHVHRSCWQGCPPQARCSPALCQHCQPTGTGTYGAVAACPKPAQALSLLWVPNQHRLWLSWCRVTLVQLGSQPRPVPSAQGWDRTWQCHPPVSSGLFGPITGRRAVPPSHEHCQPLSPHSPSGTEPAQLRAEAPSVCPGLSVGVARAGLLGWEHRVPQRFVSPAPCPDTQPQAFVGIRN